MTIRVTVFGGSQPKPGDPVYQDALHLGNLLAKAGYTLLTGGYIGTMEALSRGAVEAGGHVIGVTCDEIEAWRPVKANPWVTEDWHYTSLKERIFALIENCDACLGPTWWSWHIGRNQPHLEPAAHPHPASPPAHPDRSRLAGNRAQIFEPAG